MFSQCSVTGSRMRNAEPSDLGPIRQALVAMLAFSKAPQMKYADIEVGMAHVSECVLTSKAVFVGDFLILFDTGRPWYSQQQYIIEDIILRVYRNHPDITVRDAIDHLSVLAAQHGCVAVAAGDTQAGRMTPHYHAAGFTTLGVQLFKEVQHGLRP